jgi:predicted ATP-grasp superfamily ATP-dependent carboligase
MPWETLRQLNDKSSLYRLAADVGAAFPRSYEPAADIVPGPEAFPLVIKPASTEKPNALTKAKAWRIESAGELKARLAEATALMGTDQVIVQEMIPGGGESQFSYAGLWEHGRELASLTARRTRQFPIDFGMTSSFVETMPLPEIAEAARKILLAIGFHGLVEVEFKFDSRDGTYKVLDANTRAWAWIGIGANAGVDFPYLAWRLATGQGIPASRGGRRASWLYPGRNLLSLVQQWRRQGMPSVAEWQTMVAASTWATFSLDDPLPGVIEFPIQVGRLWRRIRRRHS